VFKVVERGCEWGAGGNVREREGGSAGLEMASIVGCGCEGVWGGVFRECDPEDSRSKCIVSLVQGDLLLCHRLHGYLEQMQYHCTVKPYAKIVFSVSSSCCWRIKLIN